MTAYFCLQELAMPTSDAPDKGYIGTFHFFQLEYSVSVNNIY